MKALSKYFVMVTELLLLQFCGKKGNMRILDHLQS